MHMMCLPIPGYRTIIADNLARLQRTAWEICSEPRSLVLRREDDGGIYPGSIVKSWMVVQREEAIERLHRSAPSPVKERRIAVTPARRRQRNLFKASVQALLDCVMALLFAALCCLVILAVAVLGPMSLDMLRSVVSH